MKKAILGGLFAAMAATTAAFTATVTAAAADYNVSEGDWSFSVEEGTGRLTVSHSGTRVLNGAYASVTYNYLGETEEHTISSLDAGKMPQVKVAEVNDCFGQGKSYTLTYEAEGAVLRHILNFYPSHPYMIVQASVSSADGRQVQSRSLTALAVSEPSTPLNGAFNRTVWVPFDNDGHVKYEVNLMKDNEECVSHEVGYVFDGESRRGLIAGSVDHDTWKSAVTIAGTNGYRIEKFECRSGHTDYFTRDVIAHGKVKGATVSSARYFVGLYDDWREGLNDFADANISVAPRLEWKGGNPMGWSSWGVQQNYINYDGVEESARFIKDSLYDLGFHDNNGQTVISLDAFATDNIPSNKLYTLGTKVFSDGTYRDGRETKQGTNQILGQYGGHLVVWGWVLDSKVDGTGLNGTPDYYWRDLALKANGELIKMNSNGGYAIDPTHPGVKANLEYAMKQYSRNGVKYVKFDFLNNGICEGDSWYDPEVTTGVQAYNYGMKLLREEAEKYGMYVVESISPIFPYQYAHGRRTCCDRFSEIGESEYVMNAMTYGWWTDRLYTVNDPDQLVMCKGGHGARETLGENRARATSGMCTGAYLFGDNFSEKVVYTDDKDGHSRGEVVGYPAESRERALIIMGNADINDYVRNHTGSFMPVDGHKPSRSQSAESVFMRNTGDALYVAVFNYDRVFTSSGTVSFERLGIDGSEVTAAKELWLGETVDYDGEGFSYSIPAKDVRVYRFTLKGGSGGITSAEADGTGEGEARVMRTGARRFQAVVPGATVEGTEVYSVAGQKVSSGRGAEIDLEGCPEGFYLVNIRLADGRVRAVKTANR